MDWEQPLHLEWQANARISGGGNEELSLSFPAPCSRVSFRLRNFRSFLRACSQAVTVFIFVRDGCIVIIMAQSIPSVPITPKAFVKSWHLLWLSTSEQERTKLLKLSCLAKPVNSNHFCEIYLQLSEEIDPFVGKKKTIFFETEKYPCVVLKCWKCFAIISYNVKHRHTSSSTFVTHTCETSITFAKREVL